MGSKKTTKKKNDDGKKPQSFNPAHQQKEVNSNFKKKDRTKSKK